MNDKNTGQQLLKTVSVRKEKGRKALESYLFYLNTDKKAITLPSVDLQTGEISGTEKIDFPVNSQLFFSQTANRDNSVFWGVHRWYRFQKNLFKREYITANQVEGITTKAGPRSTQDGQDLKNLFGTSQIEIWDTLQDSQEALSWQRETVNIFDFWAFWTAGNRPKKVDRAYYQGVFKILIKKLWNTPGAEIENKEQEIKIIL